MPKFHLSKSKQVEQSLDLECSDYESDGGTQYFPNTELGRGQYSIARKFISQQEPTRVIAVLNPSTSCVDKIEAKNKLDFFNTMYPEQMSHLILFQNDYRLVTPLIEGKPYSALKLDTQKKQVFIFLSALKAIKESHHKGRVIIDIHAENILFNSKEQKSYLIDGGISAIKDVEYIKEGTFVFENNEDIDKSRKKYKMIAPECFSQHPQIARESMDIYSLGALMNLIIKKPTPQLVRVINHCLQKLPNNRPSINNLEQMLFQRASYLPFMAFALLHPEASQSILLGLAFSLVVILVAMTSGLSSLQSASIAVSTGSFVSTTGFFALKKTNKLHDEIYELDKKTLRLYRDYKHLKSNNAINKH